LIFTVTALLERLRLPATPGRLAMCFFLSCAAFLWVELPVHRDYLSVNGAVYLLPAFLAGLGVSRFTAAVVKLPCKPAWAGVAAFALAAALHHGTLLGLVDADISRRGPISLVCAVAGSYALYVWQPVSRFWAYLGAHSYAIYLFHIFATAGTRLVMHKIQMTDTATVFITSTLAGIVLPLLAETVCARFAVGRYVLLGGKWRSGTSAQQTIPKRR
jgi:peptidoglycan/LPS O-acetylase OafA/YrhL